MPKKSILCVFAGMIMLVVNVLVAQAETLPNSCVGTSQVPGTGNQPILVQVVNNCGRCANISTNVFKDGVAQRLIATTWPNVPPGAARNDQYLPDAFGNWVYRVVNVETCESAPPSPPIPGPPGQACDTPTKNVQHMTPAIVGGQPRQIVGTGQKGTLCYFNPSSSKTQKLKQTACWLVGQPPSAEYDNWTCRTGDDCGGAVFGSLSISKLSGGTRYCVGFTNQSGHDYDARAYFTFSN